MKVLIIGITGYLGTELANCLANAGHELYGVIRNGSDVSNLENLNITYVLNERDELGALFRSIRIDWIINTACKYHQDESLYWEMLNSNLVFPLEVLNEGMKNSVTRFMTMGTSLPEMYNFYSYSKYKLSSFGEFFAKTNDISFIDLGLEMFFGGRFEPEDRFIKRSIKYMMEGRELILTSGYQKRDIIYVDDIDEIVLRLIELEYVIGYRRLPVGSGEQHSIRDIITYIHKQLHSASVLTFGGITDRENEPDTKADISWYKDIRYELRYPFFEGLNKEIQDLMKGMG